MKKKKIVWQQVFFIKPVFRTPILLSILATLIVSFLAITYFFRLQPIIPLLYTLPLAEQQLVDKRWLFIFPSLSLFFNFNHFLVLRYLKNRQLILLQIFAWSTVLLQFLLFWAMVRIILIIT